uniref:Uncharacterized protein LOC8284508 n=1 Tax=Rhizophora mucronata TaxID=61149 RepID=A0A2P2KY53_RHIMU
MVYYVLIRRVQGNAQALRISPTDLIVTQKGFVVLDGLLDEVDEVDDIYAANDISGACQDFLLDMELAEKVSDLDCIPFGGSHVVISSSESQSPGFSGSSNGTLVLSESSTATIPESECKNGSFQKTVVNKYDSLGNQCKDEASEHSQFPRLQDSENLDQFGNDTKCFVSGTSSDLYEKEVQGTKISMLLRQKRLRRPTKRYTEEFFSPKSKQDMERHTVASAVSKNKHWKVRSSSELHHVRALTCRPEEKSFGSATTEVDPEDYEKLSDLRSRCLIERRKASCLIEGQQGSLSVPTGRHLKTKSSNEHHVRVLRSSLKEESLTTQTPSESRPRRGRPQKHVILLDDESIASESEDNHVKKRSKKHDDRRKHQRMWTLSEVTKLVDGIAQYGTGRWTDIKKHLFSSSAYRTPIDLRDKWRNLLRTSCPQKQKQKKNKKEVEHKLKHGICSLPKSVMHRICELASIHPYPRFTPGGRYIRRKN